MEGLRDFAGELLTERCKWALAIDRCDISDKQRRGLIEFLPMIAEVSLLHGGDDAAMRFIEKHVPKEEIK